MTHLYKIMTTAGPLEIKSPKAITEFYRTLEIGGEVFLAFAAEGDLRECQLLVAVKSILMIVHPEEPLIQKVPAMPPSLVTKGS